MKKRKRTTVRHHDQFDEEDEDMIEHDEIEQHDAPALLTAGDPVPIPLNARDVSTYCGTQTFRGCVTKDSDVGPTIQLGALPAYAAVYSGGVWVTEAFDGGATLNVGNYGDPNTFASVDLSVVGFTPLNLKPDGRPNKMPSFITGKITATGALTSGRADVIIEYA